MTNHTGKYTSGWLPRDNKCAFILLVSALVVLLAGCDGIFAVPNPSPTVVVQPTATTIPSAAPTNSPTATGTYTPSPTSEPTQTATQTSTPTETLTPTREVASITSRMQAFCRYGPGQAYLYAHGLYEGDRAVLDGKNYSGTWLWVQPEDLDWHCWVSASVVDVSADLAQVPVVQSRLPQSTLYGPPEEVEAWRDGGRVVVVWEEVWMTEDDFRGYMIEATLCQDGRLVSLAVQTDHPRYEFEDGTGCDGASGGLLYTVEKHGYTTPVKIPWP